MATGISEDDNSTLVSLRLIDIEPISGDILKQFEVSKRKVNMHIPLGVCENSQPLYRKAKQQETSGAEISLPRVHPTSDKGQLLIACSSNNIPTVCNMEIGKEVIRLK